MWDTLIIQPFTNVLLMITMLVKNFGLAIILFTILIKLITFPLTAKQIKSTQAVQELQKSPRYLKLQEKYKDNKEKLAEEQFKLQRELGVSPFAPTFAANLSNFCLICSAVCTFADGEILNFFILSVFKINN